MTDAFTFSSDRGDIRRYRRSHRLAYIVRELPARLEVLAQDLCCPASGRVLDYGCADVPYRRFFPASVEYLAADIPGNADATIMVNPDGTVPVPDDSIDVVLSTQVLEHVHDPQRYLAECHRVLRPGGRLLLSTHGLMIYHPDPVDLWRWTGEGLKEAVQRERLEVLRFEGIMGLPATGLQFVQDGLLARVPRRLQRVFTFLVQSVIGFVERHEPSESRNLNAMVFALVAEKPSRS